MAEKPRIYKAEIAGWALTGAVYPDGTVTLTPFMPEQMAVRFETTGRQGGDAGHGGWAKLSFIENDSHCWYSTHAEILGDEDELRGVSLTTKGDWELTGMAAVLIFLGQILSIEGHGRNA